MIGYLEFGKNAEVAYVTPRLGLYTDRLKFRGGTRLRLAVSWIIPISTRYLRGPLFSSDGCVKGIQVIK